MAGKLEVVQRREQVKIMALQGTTQESISQQLNVPLRTIERDFSEIREQMKEGYKTTFNEELNRFVNTHDFVLSELWKIYKEADQLHKVKILKLVNESASNRLQILKEIGILNANKDTQVIVSWKGCSYSCQTCEEHDEREQNVRCVSSDVRRS